MNPYFETLIRNGMIPCKEYENKRIPVDIDIDTVKPPVATDKDIKYITYTYAGYSEYNLLNILQFSFSNLALKKEVNRRLNFLCKDYESKKEVCPRCGNYTISIGNDGNYCKFCGQKLKEVPIPEKFPEISGQITLFRKKLKVSQCQLAKKMCERGPSISRSKLSLFERGASKPTSFNLYLIADALGVSPEYLCGGLPKREKGKKPLRFTLSDYGFQMEEKDIDEGKHYIYTCPCCGEKVDLRPLEAMSINRRIYEMNRYITDNNDGDFCKYCGQEIERPIKIKWDKIPEVIKVYIRMILRQIKKEDYYDTRY